MKLELRNIKHSALASQETHCYRATLYVNGNAVADVGNEGFGGCDYQHPAKGVHPLRFNEVMKEVADHFALMPAEQYPWDKNGEYLMQPNLEGWCCDQVNLFLRQRDLKNKLKSSVLFARDGSIYRIPTRGKPAQWVQECIAHHQKKGLVVLNTLTFEEALKIFSEAA